MSTRLNPYLTFDGTARAAMEFYAEVFGGDLAIDTYGESGDSSSPGADRVMHAMLETEAGYTIMAGDVNGEQDPEPMSGFSVSLSGDDADRLRGYWNQLVTEGSVPMPLEKQSWGDEFGMCVDRFGVRWMVNISQA